jgi:hypothetical protein
MKNYIYLLLYLPLCLCCKKTQDTPTITIHHIGDTYAGGIIFYLDSSGEHGLVAAASDQSASAQWGCNSTDTSAINYDFSAPGVIADGATNTDSIVSTSCASIGTSARICHDLVLNGYSDWFLPSFWELMQMENNLYKHVPSLGNFSTDDYWSSTENSDVYAWIFIFNDLYGAYGTTAKTNRCHVRAARAF